MRTYEKIILHCTATVEGAHYDVDTIRQWHTSPPRNWRDIGYHFLVYLDGLYIRAEALQKLVPIARGRIVAVWVLHTWGV